MKDNPTWHEKVEFFIVFIIVIFIGYCVYKQIDEWIIPFAIICALFVYRMSERKVIWKEK